MDKNSSVLPGQYPHLFLACACWWPPEQVHGHHSHQVCTALCCALSCVLSLLILGLHIPSGTMATLLFSESTFFKAQADVYHKDAYAVILPP